MSNLLTFTDRGIYCPAGDFYIDPWRPVDRALITHGHADHARPRMQRYLVTEAAAPVIRYRLGDDITLETTPYGVPITIGDATVSFHPAGHVPGSAQIRVEVAGKVWVVSGDYKVAPDGLSEPFEPVACHAFITECTFGLPVFKWLPQDAVVADINAWWQANRDAGKTSAIGAYALGKAQRILANIDTSIGPVLTHAAIENTNEVLRAQGIDLPATHRLTADLDRKAHPGALIIATPSALNTNWPRGFGPVSTRVRERLDGAARRPPPPLGRSWLHPLRPCRLARPQRGHCRDGCRAHLRDAWLHRRLPPLARRAGI